MIGIIVFMSCAVSRNIVETSPTCISIAWSACLQVPRNQGLALSPLAKEFTHKSTCWMHSSSDAFSPSRRPKAAWTFLSLKTDTKALCSLSMLVSVIVLLFSSKLCSSSAVARQLLRMEAISTPCNAGFEIISVAIPCSCSTCARCLRMVSGASCNFVKKPTIDIVD